MFVWIIKKIFQFHFWIRGWTVVTEFDFSKHAKFIILGGGHTTNWDFVYAMGCFGYFDFDLNFTIKEEWIKFPFGFFMKSLGAIGIDRARKTGEKQTDIMAKLFTQRDKLCLVVTPEGTRKPVTKWKSGFYYIAQAAKIPIVPGHLDYKNKVAHIGRGIDPSEGYEETMKKVMNYYKGIHPGKIENFKLDERFI